MFGAGGRCFPADGCSTDRPGLPPSQARLRGMLLLSRPPLMSLFPAKHDYILTLAATWAGSIGGQGIAANGPSP